MRTPDDKRVTLTFYSYPTKRLTMRWKAKVTFEPGSVDDSLATVTLVDGEETPVPRAWFEVAGQRIDIRDGRGELRCGDFVKGKHETPIWVQRKGMLPIPGALTFE